MGHRRKTSAASLCNSIVTSMQRFHILHISTFLIIYYSTVLFLGARVSLNHSLVPQLKNITFVTAGSRTQIESNKNNHRVRHRLWGKFTVAGSFGLRDGLKLHALKRTAFSVFFFSPRHKALLTVKIPGYVDTV